jgi:hypothetical protein
MTQMLVSPIDPDDPNQRCSICGSAKRDHAKDHDYDPAADEMPRVQPVRRRGEPRFDLDYSYGVQGELQIGTLLTWIASGNGQVEVKRKRYLDLDFYIETHCDKGRRGQWQPSGISVTTAAAWAFVIGDTDVAVIIPTEQVRAMLTDPSSFDRAETDGECPTRGKLISLAALLYRHKQQQKHRGAS